MKLIWTDQSCVISDRSVQTAAGGDHPPSLSLALSLHDCGGKHRKMTCSVIHRNTALFFHMVTLREHNNPISLGRDFSAEAVGKKKKKKETKVKKTVWLWQGFQWFLQFSSGAPEPGLSATWVAHLLLASLLLYCRWLRALVSIIAHILTANVDFVSCRKSRGSSKHCCGPTSTFLWRVQVCPSRPSVSPAATPPYLSHKTQQEERTRLETTTWPPPPPPLLPSSPSQHLSSLICIALALNLIIFSVNKPGSGRNYTQLGVRSFSRKGPGSFYLKCFLFLLL